VEVDENEVAGGARSNDVHVHKRIVKEMIRSIEAAADFEDFEAREPTGSGRRTWVAIKLVNFICGYYLEWPLT
jgi:proline dehydrogenase